MVKLRKPLAGNSFAHVGNRIDESELNELMESNSLPKGTVFHQGQAYSPRREQGSMSNPVDDMKFKGLYEPDDTGESNDDYIIPNVVAVPLDWHEDVDRIVTEPPEDEDEESFDFDEEGERSLLDAQNEAEDDSYLTELNLEEDPFRIGDLDQYEVE